MTCHGRGKIQFKKKVYSENLFKKLDINYVLLRVNQINPMKTEPTIHMI